MRSATRILAAASLLACGDGGPAPSAPPPPPPPTPPAILARMWFLGTYGSTFVGQSRSVVVMGQTTNGDNASTDSAVVTSSDSRVIAIDGTRSVMLSLGRGKFVWITVVDIAAVGSGAAVLRANVRGVDASTLLTVDAIPNRASSMRVESFALAEYRRGCDAQSCGLSQYLPLLRLHAAPGFGLSTVELMEVTMPGWHSGWCATGTGVPFAPGESALLAGIGDDPDAMNELFFVREPGQPLPGDTARVRLVVRDPDGQLGLLVAHGPIRRGVPLGDLPPANATYNGWSCPGREGI